MQNLQQELIALLQNSAENENFIAENQLNRNKIVEAALKLSPQLIGLLLKHETFKNHFFAEVEGTMVFDKIKFQRFVNNKSFLPDSYTAFKNKIGLAINDDTTDNYLKAKNDVVLVWPHKDCVLEGGQTKEDQKRNEIFWNETLAPESIDRLLDTKALTNFKKYDAKGEHKVTEIKGDENLILKGNNLLVLCSLLKTHRGKIKLIYIDPPYNTGNDSFQYNDSFNHSSWLTFMKNRLIIARKLLKEDGLIFVQCDDNEQGYLKVLMDEVFGRDNFRNLIISKVGTKSVQNQFDTWDKLSNGCDLILFYSKDKDYRFPKAQVNVELKAGSWNNHWRGTDRPTMRYDLFGIKPEKGQWRWSKEKSLKAKLNYEDMLKKIGISDPSNEIIDKWYLNQESKPELLRLSKNGKPEHYIPPTNRQSLNSVWMDLKSNANSEIFKLFDGKVFDTPKSETLMERIISFTTKENDIVLDYHLGSGTTAVVAHKMNRRYIGIEQMDYIENVSVERLKKVIGKHTPLQKGEEVQVQLNLASESNVAYTKLAYDQGGISKEVNWQGGGSFVYAELMQYNQYFIDQIQEANTKEAILAVWTEMQDKAFLSYQFNKDLFNERLDAFKTASLETMQHYLIELLDKNQLYVNLSEIEDESYRISQEEKALNYAFYKK